MLIHSSQKSLDLKLLSREPQIDSLIHKTFPNAPSPRPPPSCIATSPDRCLIPLRLRPPVRVLPALHQHHQGVEPEEDDDGDDDPLEDDPDVDATGGVRQLAVVSQLLDCRRWVLETKGVSSPHNQVEEDQKGHNL